jgi:putative acetyltransferase
MIIRPETPEDINAIEQITIAAFKGKRYSDGTEHLIINRLREAQALVLSLVAEINGQIVGQVAFSVVTINGEAMGWYGLGPISVHPDFQKQGIGSNLIREGLARIRAMGAHGCVLEGDPEYYQRVGFESYASLVYGKAPAPRYFMAFPFSEDVPSGSVEFHEAFYSPTSP